MIAERSSDVEIQSNITGQSFAAGIDDENMAWVIGLFTDLYSDPQRAVIREYSTNAADAQVEEGYTGPIEVTLPNPLSPFFKIKDRGCGLDANDIRTIYSRYGSSTKRGTNDQNGMLGMGCKSALAYTQQFTVESVKDSVRTVCSISREDGGVPVFTVVASLPAPGEPNGTEVIVPVNRYHHDDFARKAAEFYSYWTPGTVLVNGEQPVPIEGLKLNDDMLVMKQSQNYGSRKLNQIVMGNVAYPLAQDQFDSGLPYDYYIVITVPIGSVEFAPSREALNYTSKLTQNTLAGLKPKLEKAVEASVQREIAKAQTPREAIKKMIEWRGLLGRNTVQPRSFMFKGKPLPDKIEGHWTLVNASTRKLSQHEKAPNGFLSEYAANALFVTGYTPTQFTAQHKRKLVQFATDNGHDPAYFALTAQTDVDSEVVEDSQIVSWDDVKAVKLPTNSSGAWWRSNRPTGSYDAYIAGQSQHIQAADIEVNDPIYYCRSMNTWQAAYAAEIIGKYFPKATVVCLPENRYNKFMRNFPTAKRYTEGVQAAYDVYKKKLTKNVQDALRIEDHGSPHVLRALDPLRVDDPDLRREARLARVDIKKAIQDRDTFRRVMNILKQTDVKEYVDPVEKYPLLGHLGSNVIRHYSDDVYHYLNAAYAASV